MSALDSGIGGGFGPDDFSYMDYVGVVWYSNVRASIPKRVPPARNVWTGGGKRYQRGQIPADNSEMFVSGVTGPGQPTTAVAARVESGLGVRKRHL